MFKWAYQGKKSNAFLWDSNPRLSAFSMLLLLVVVVLVGEVTIQLSNKPFLQLSTSDVAKLLKCDILSDIICIVAGQISFYRESAFKHHMASNVAFHRELEEKAKNRKEESGPNSCSECSLSFKVSFCFSEACCSAFKTFEALICIR